MKNTDAYANTLTGLALSADKSTRSVFTPTELLDWEELSDRYEQDAIVARIIDRLPDDATREKFEIKGEDEEIDFASVQSELEDLDVRTELGDAWRWARLYRGSLVVMHVNDGKKMEEPLDLRAVTKLSALHVIEAQHITPNLFGNGIGSSGFGRPDVYEIMVPYSNKNPVRHIHRTRVLRFDGIKVSLARMWQNGGWGPSVLDRINVEVTRLGEVQGYARGIMHDISMMILKIEGYREMACGTAKEQADLQKIIENIRMSMDSYHIAAFDTKDDFVEVTRTVTGLRDLLQEFVDGVVRATDMPRTVLLGEQPGGLNASGDSEIRAWYDFVASQQPKVLTPAINRILEVLFAARRNHGEPVPDEWTIEYAQLWQPTEKEIAETEFIRAQTESLRLADATMTAPEVRAALISRGVLPEDAEEELEPDESEIEALKLQLEMMKAQPPIEPAPGAPPLDATPPLIEPEPEPEPDDGE